MTMIAHVAAVDTFAPHVAKTEFRRNRNMIVEATRRTWLSGSALLIRILGSLDPVEFEAAGGF